jgi:hypothetical protein
VVAACSAAGGEAELDAGAGATTAAVAFVGPAPTPVSEPAAAEPGARGDADWPALGARPGSFFGVNPPGLADPAALPCEPAPGFADSKRAPLAPVPLAAAGSGAAPAPERGEPNPALALPSLEAKADAAGAAAPEAGFTAAERGAPPSLPGEAEPDALPAARPAPELPASSAGALGLPWLAADAAAVAVGAAITAALPPTPTAALPLVATEGAPGVTATGAAAGLDFGGSAGPSPRPDFTAADPAAAPGLPFAAEAGGDTAAAPARTEPDGLAIGPGAVNGPPRSPAADASLAAGLAAPAWLSCAGEAEGAGGFLSDMPDPEALPPATAGPPGAAPVAAARLLATGLALAPAGFARLASEAAASARDFACGPAAPLPASAVLRAAPGGGGGT